MRELKETLEMVKNRESVILLNNQEAVEILENILCLDKASLDKHYLYFEDGECKWGSELVDFSCELIDADEIDFN